MGPTPKHSNKLKRKTAKSSPVCKVQLNKDTKNMINFLNEGASQLLETMKVAYRYCISWLIEIKMSNGKYENQISQDVI